MKDPSPWDAQICNRCHIYRQHQHQHQKYVYMRDNHVDNGDNDDKANDICSIATPTRAVLEFKNCRLLILPTCI